MSLKIVTDPDEAIADRDDRIENHLMEMRSIITAMDATIEGERFLSARGFLWRQLNKHHSALERLLLAGR
jgi:hypothetical protein